VDKINKKKENNMTMKQFIEAARPGTIEPNFDKYPQDRNKDTKITFQDFDDGEQSMNCPTCGCECTHITGVEVFTRGEDREEHTHTTVDMETNKTTVERIKGHGRNPSGRRDGVILSGYCESGCKFEIEIAQHKGNTFFRSNKTGSHGME
jgi:hypothetical protein